MSFSPPPVEGNAVQQILPPGDSLIRSFTSSFALWSFHYYSNGLHLVTSHPIIGLDIFGRMNITDEEKVEIKNNSLQLDELYLDLAKGAFL